MPDFKNPLANPNLTYKGKTAAQRGEELLAEQKKRDLEERLNKKRKKKEPETQTQAEQPETNQASVVADENDFLVLDNIACIGADGRQFERYDKIWVAKDIVREQDRSQKNFIPYQGAVYFEQNGLLLPSFALSCNILAALYADRSDAIVKGVLEQYKDKGSGTGWHAQNTVIDYGNKKIIHYPSDSDFPEYGGNDGINQGKRKEIGFSPSKLDDLTLEEALKVSNFKKFIKNLTGLTKPELLIDIAKYFGRTARIWVADNPDSADYTASAWLGCDSGSFSLDADDYLSINNAARGVSEKNFHRK